MWVIASSPISVELKKIYGSIVLLCDCRNQMYEQVRQNGISIYLARARQSPSDLKNLFLLRR